MSGTLGSLVVRIGADISGLRGDVGQATKHLEGMGARSERLVNGLRSVGAAIAAIGLAKLVKDQMDAIDTAAKLSRQLGGTITGLKSLQLAAADAGVDSGALEKATQKLNQRLGEAARMGSGPAYEALQRLGLSARDLARMDLDTRMAAIADAMREQGLSASATADTLAQLGVRQGELSRLFADGGDAIRGAREELIAMGAALSEVDAAKVEAAGDSLARTKTVVEGIAQRITVQLSPMITFLSDQFVALAKDTGGFKDAVDGAVSFALKAIGFLADSIRGVHLVFKSVELAAWGLGTAIVDVVRYGAEGITLMIDESLKKVNELIAAFNEMPGIDITPLSLTSDSSFMQALHGFADTMEATTADVWKQLQTLATSEWPSDKVQKFFTEMQAAAQKAGEETVRARRAMDGTSMGDEAGDEAAQKEAQKQREKLEQQLQTLREFAMTEEELENEKHARRLEQLNQALDAELLALTEFHEISQGLEREHAEALEKIRGDSAKRLERVQDALMGSLSTASQGLAKSLDVIAQQAHGNYMALAQSANASDRKRAADAERHARHMFDVNKGFAIADALVQGALGVAKTLGAYPYPENLLLAVPHAAAAAAQVATISAQQFQSSGGTVSAPSGGGAARMSSGSSSPVGSAHGGSITGGATQVANITLNGENYSRSQVLSLIEGLNEALADGARLVVT